MSNDKKFLVDVGLGGLVFPITVLSKGKPEGQQTVATISISARIMHEFEAFWIDRFIQILHKHRDNIGQTSFKTNIKDYATALGAEAVSIEFSYPFFIEKTTPVSGEKCLVKYNCVLSTKLPTLEKVPPVFLRIDVPVLTTYPQSQSGLPYGLFAQQSVVALETHSFTDLFVEDLVEIVESHALSPVYSFLTDEDQAFLIKKLHTESQTSVMMLDGVRQKMASNKDIDWFSVRCANFGMLHSYNTTIGAEKSLWIPYSGGSDDGI